MEILKPTTAIFKDNPTKEIDSDNLWLSTDFVQLAYVVLKTGRYPLQKWFGGTLFGAYSKDDEVLSVLGEYKRNGLIEAQALAMMSKKIRTDFLDEIWRKKREGETEDDKRQSKHF